MDIIVTDMEGVLLPEIWQELAKKTKIDELMITTKEEPDFEKLMKNRLKILKENGLTIEDIKEVIKNVKPLDGADQFIKWVRSQTEMLILSDTYQQFVQALNNDLDWPTILCHSLEINDDGLIIDYTIRIRDQKVKAVNALKDLNYNVIAIGDSYNDIRMLSSADNGFLYKPSNNVKEDHKEFKIAYNYLELQTEISKFLSK